MPRKRILHDLTLDKIAAVDFPCQEPATMTIIKRSYTEDQRTEMADKGWALPDGSFPIADVSDLKNAIHAYGRSKAKGKAKAHIITRARALDSIDLLPEDWNVTKSLALREVLEKIDSPTARGFEEILAENEAQEKCWAAQSALWPLFDALRESLSSIATDATLDPATKLVGVSDSVNQFLGALQSEWPEVAAEVDQIAKASPNVDQMATFIKMKEAIMAGNTIAELQKALDEKAASFDLLKAENETLKAKAKAKPNAAAAAEDAADGGDDDDMEDADGNLTKKGLVFLDKHRPVVEGADEIIKVGEKSFAKSKVGADAFEMMKAQQAEIVKERDERIVAQMEKRAGDEMPLLPGTAGEKALVLKALMGVPEAVRKTAESMLTAGEKAIKSAFVPAGIPGGVRSPEASASASTLAKARVDFMTKVSEIKARDKSSRTAAMQKAQIEFPDLWKMYREADQDSASAAA